MKFCAVHTHSILCDGKNTLAEMAEAARQAGAVAFGASGHSHTPIPTDVGGVLPRDMTEYQQEVLRLRSVYAGRMDVLLGLELDSQADVTPEGFDYWIGSVHYLRHPETGAYHCIDWDRACLEAAVRAWNGSRNLVEAYWRDEAAMAQRNPTILGHLDLITKLNGDGSFFDETADWYRQAALTALEAADPEKTLLEINTGGMWRGCRTTPYPAQFLLKAWRERGGQVILTTDAHHADSISFGLEAAAAHARAAGYGETVLLTRSGRQPCLLEKS